MSEERVVISEEEQAQRNKKLRKKKSGIYVALVMMAVVMGGLIYLLQSGENMTSQTLLTIVGGLTLMLFACALMVLRFTRKINLDMHSNEKIVEIGRVVRAPGRYANAAGMATITLDIHGRLLVLSRQQFKHALSQAYDMNRIFLYDSFRLEFTPYGQHLMRIERL